MRFLFGLCLSLIWATLCFAQERITNYDVDIQVETSGDIVITETIDVVSEGDQIRRGIFRELPMRYTFMGVTQDYDYDLIDVTRDGKPDAVTRLSQGNAITWRIGRAEVFLDNGPHQYVIRYRVGDAVRRQDGRDELYWNATGTYWDFPIENARATVRFPSGADVTDTYAYTGGRNSRASDATIDIRGDMVTFKTLQALPRKAGMTISASIAPGVIAPMSAARKAELNWIRYGAMIMLGAGGLALLLYYWSIWNRIGRDPQKPPVFARYAPPEGYSPAAVHYIHHKGLKGMDALSALLMQLGGQGILDIKADKKVTTIWQRQSPVEGADAQTLISELMNGRNGKLILDGETDTKFYKAVSTFHKTLAKRYGAKYHKYNIGWAALGIVASVVLAVIVLAAPVAKSNTVVLGLFAAIVGMNGLFLFLLPAPTKRGAEVSAEIDGFKLYLETAEEDRINMADPVSGRAPAMTVELYERFLPYAMALGVEKPWTKQFETSLPREAAEYRPSYATGNAFRSGKGPVDFSKTMTKTLTAGVAAAAPVSQSSGSGFSSGSGGGGFSGGGGGGGGGGGW